MSGEVVFINTKVCLVQQNKFSKLLVKIRLRVWVMLFSCSVNESRCKPVCVCVFVSIGVVRAATKQHSGWGLQGYRQPWHLKCCDSTILTGAGPHLLSSLLHHQLISQWKPPQLSEWKIRGWSWSGESHHACVYCKKKKSQFWLLIAKLLSFTVLQLCISSLCRGVAGEREQEAQEVAF